MNIIPLPKNAVEKDKNIKLGKDTVVEGEFPETSAKVVDFVSQFDGGENVKIRFSCDVKIPKEGYVIICERNTVNVSASSEAGAFYAFATLRQLTNEKGELRAVDVQDSPKYAFRGFMLDCARHFWSVDKIKEYLDVMALLKMNVFHWHLTEDQGWRAEIKKYPLLTEKGCIRRSTWLAKHGYAKGKAKFEDKPYGEGLYYSQEQMLEIVAYAADRHIEVIPEVDMPGHMVAAIACYPELSCTGEETEVSTAFGVMDNICCCGKDNIFNFAKDVIDELCEIFPGRYFHIGGDEVPKTRWKRCPLCQEKIKKLQLKDENALQGHFNNEIAKYLRSKGKRMIGWNEVLDAQEIMDNDVVAQWWTTHSVGNKNEFRWMEKGGECVLSMCPYVYMDHPYNVRPLKKTYSFSAAKLSVRDDSKILGMEIQQWTEYIRVEEKLDMLVYARLVAFAEVCWTQDNLKDYNDFEMRLESMRPYFDSIGAKLCPQKIYRGKVYPGYALAVPLRWDLWSKNPDYEFNEMKNLNK